MTVATIDYSIPAMREWKKLPEGILAEVISGTLYVSPPPTPYHQRTSHRLYVDITNHVESNQLGEMFFAPTGIVLKDGTNVVIPDIVFISKDNPLIINRKGVHGPPDLCIEILSPSTGERDKTIKHALYEQAGVKEYWLADPETKDATGFILEKGTYGTPLKMNSKIHVRILNKTFKF